MARAHHSGGQQVRCLSWGDGHGYVRAHLVVVTQGVHQVSQPRTRQRLAKHNVIHMRQGDLMLR